MATIKIRNAGPIKEATLELNKVNVFMGAQSSGKSTVSKIITMCQWVEKRRMADGFYADDFYEELLKFNNFEDAYFPVDSSIDYQGKYCRILFSGATKETKIEVISDDGIIDFRKSKCLYIPSERNFVSTIPNLGKYNEKHNNMMAFLFNWRTAKEEYTEQNSLYVKQLGIHYYYIKEQDKDIIVLEDGTKIVLQNASSGLQSMIPLFLTVGYYSKDLYLKKMIMSSDEKMYYDKLLMIVRQATDINLETVNSKEGSLDLRKTIEGYTDVMHEKAESELLKGYQQYFSTQFIIEEPEQNLFPSTQRDLIYYMLDLIRSKDDHQLTIATHSPYILYALNNCMMGYLVKDNIPKEKLEEKKEKLPSMDSWINPELVSVWQIKDGKIESIKDKRTNTVGKHYFNGVMNEVMDEYYIMLNFLKV